MFSFVFNTVGTGGEELKISVDETRAGTKIPHKNNFRQQQKHETNEEIKTAPPKTT